MNREAKASAFLQERGWDDPRPPHPADATEREIEEWERRTRVLTEHLVRQEVADRFNVSPNDYAFDTAFRNALAGQAAREYARLLQQPATPHEMPRKVNLAELLAEPDEPSQWLIQDLWPKQGRVLLAARQKAGKTTFVGNLTRSVADGVPFLDRYLTSQVQRVVLMDNEMSEPMIRNWLRDQGIEHPERVDVIPLRGRLSSFDILDQEGRDRWAEFIGSADVLIFDCLRPALDALGLDENRDTGRFLTALDELCSRAEISELLVVHHMGHNGERARGDSRLVGWPDANWKLVPTLVDGEPDEAGPRYFSAFGRDVDVAESQLAYDRTTRHLSLLGGSRATVVRDEAERAVLEFVGEQTIAVTATAIKQGINGFSDKAILAARQRLVASGRLTERPRPGRGGGQEYLLPKEEEQ